MAQKERKERCREASVILGGITEHVEMIGRIMDSAITRDAAASLSVASALPPEVFAARSHAARMSELCAELRRALAAETRRKPEPEGGQP